MLILDNLIKKDKAIFKGDEDNKVVMYRKLFKNSVKRQFIVEHNLAIQFEGDLRGLLLRSGIEEDELQLVYWLNGYKNPELYDGKKVTFYIPGKDILDQLKKISK